MMNIPKRRKLIIDQHKRILNYGSQQQKKMKENVGKPLDQVTTYMNIQTLNLVPKSKKGEKIPTNQIGLINYRSKTLPVLKDHFNEQKENYAHGTSTSNMNNLNLFNKQFNISQFIEELKKNHQVNFEDQVFEKNNKSMGTILMSFLQYIQKKKKKQKDNKVAISKSLYTKNSLEKQFQQLNKQQRSSSTNLFKSLEEKKKLQRQRSIKNRAIKSKENLFKNVKTNLLIQNQIIVYKINGSDEKQKQKVAVQLQKYEQIRENLKRNLSFFKNQIQQKRKVLTKIQRDIFINSKAAFRNVMTQNGQKKPKTTKQLQQMLDQMQKQIINFGYYFVKRPRELIEQEFQKNKQKQMQVFDYLSSLLSSTPVKIDKQIEPYIHKPIQSFNSIYLQHINRDAMRTDYKNIQSFNQLKDKLLFLFRQTIEKLSMIIKDKHKKIIEFLNYMSTFSSQRNLRLFYNQQSLMKMAMISIEKQGLFKDMHNDQCTSKR